MIQVGWGIPFHTDARCEWYLSPIVVNEQGEIVNRPLSDKWVPVYVGEDDAVVALKRGKNEL